MKFTKLLSNLTLKNAKYFIKGYYLRFLQKEYNKHFNSQDVMNMIYRGAMCKECVENMTCLHCGCSTVELIMSGKPCKKLEENVES